MRARLATLLAASLWSCNGLAESTIDHLDSKRIFQPSNTAFFPSKWAIKRIARSLGIVSKLKVIGALSSACGLTNSKPA